MKKTSHKKEINIFIENAYEDFFIGKSEPDNDLRKITEDAVSMTRFFLSKPEWVGKSCLQDYDFKVLCFDVVFINDEKIHEINRDYREKDRATDVITFAMFADSEEDERFIFDEEINLGEILISLDTTLHQAQGNKHSFENELYFLLAHGILHLLGYDHQSEETLQEMWDIQQEIIKAGLSK